MKSIFDISATKGFKILFILYVIISVILVLTLIIAALDNYYRSYDIIDGEYQVISKYETVPFLSFDKQLSIKCLVSIQYENGDISVREIVFDVDLDTYQNYEVNDFIQVENNKIKT